VVEKAYVKTWGALLNLMDDVVYLHGAMKRRKTQFLPAFLYGIKEQG